MVVADSGLFVWSPSDSKSYDTFVIAVGVVGVSV